ncbi:4F2 cell-surface antigen heavy chain-like [Rhinoraja longicauda]
MDRGPKYVLDSSSSTLLRGRSPGTPPSQGVKASESAEKTTSIKGEQSSQHSIHRPSTTPIAVKTVRLSTTTRAQAIRLPYGDYDRYLGKMELQIESGPKWMWIQRFSMAFFWVSLVCMLVSATAFIIQNPQCKPPPKLRWWQKGPIYRIALQSFRDTSADGIGDLRGIQRQLQYISQLHVVALVVIPFTVMNGTRMSNVTKPLEARFGPIQDLSPLLKAATRYGIKIIFDLTPLASTLEKDFWANVDNEDAILADLLVEFHYWFKQGVDGIFIKMSTVSLKQLEVIDILKTWKTLAKKYSSSSKIRIFVVATSQEEHDYLISVLENIQGEIIFIYYLKDILTNAHATSSATTLEYYHHKNENEWCGFLFGDGHIASMMLQKSHGIHFKLYSMLLFTIPGTPTFYYGDELALTDYKQQAAETLSVLSLFRMLGQIRKEEPPLQYGDFHIMINTTTVLSYIRQWDHLGILVILNFGGIFTYDFTASYLPRTALLLAKSTDISQYPQDCPLIQQQRQLNCYFEREEDPRFEWEELTSNQSGGCAPPTWDLGPIGH